MIMSKNKIVKLLSCISCIILFFNFANANYTIKKDTILIEEDSLSISVEQRCNECFLKIKYTNINDAVISKKLKCCWNAKIRKDSKLIIEIPFGTLVRINGTEYSYRMEDFIGFSYDTCNVPVKLFHTIDGYSPLNYSSVQKYNSKGPLEILKIRIKYFSTFSDSIKDIIERFPINILRNFYKRKGFIKDLELAVDDTEAQLSLEYDTDVSVNRADDTNLGKYTFHNGQHYIKINKDHKLNPNLLIHEFSHYFLGITEGFNESSNILPFPEWILLYNDSITNCSYNTHSHNIRTSHFNDTIPEGTVAFKQLSEKRENFSKDYLSYSKKRLIFEESTTLGKVPSLDDEIQLYLYCYDCILKDTLLSMDSNVIKSYLKIEDREFINIDKVAKYQYETYVNPPKRKVYKEDIISKKSRRPRPEDQTELLSFQKARREEFRESRNKKIEFWLAKKTGKQY